MQADDRVYLEHMRDHARRACALVAGRSRAQFDEDEPLRLALCYLIQIVGEAANHISETAKERHLKIPWHDIVGMRHRLGHGCFDVDEHIVWQAVTQELRPLAAALDRVLNY